MSLFFSKEGKHIVCGGTTSTIVARNSCTSRMVPKLDYLDPEIPPIAQNRGRGPGHRGRHHHQQGAGVRQGLSCADNASYSQWGYKRDGASLIARMLFEEATDINFFVGRAINPAHQNPNLPINFNIKMRLVEELSECLKQMGKRIKVSYF